MELEITQYGAVDTSLFDCYVHFNWFEGASEDAIAQIVGRRSYQTTNLSCLQYQIKGSQIAKLLDKGMVTIVCLRRIW